MVKAFIAMLLIGIVLGIILGIASKLFYVKVDTRIADLTALLPGYNCGGCGFAGCAGLAEAIVSKKGDVKLCKPAKPEQREVIIKYLKENSAES